MDIMSANEQSLATVISNYLSLGQFELTAACIVQLYGARKDVALAILQSLVDQGAFT